MEIVKELHRKLLRLHLSLPLSAAITWLIMLSLTRTKNDPVGGLECMFALFSAFITLLVYKNLNTDLRIRVIPRKSDFLTILFITPCAAAIVDIGIRLFFWKSVCTLPDILIISPTISLVSFGTLTAITDLSHTLGFRRRVVVEGNPITRELVIRGLENRGITDQVEVIPLSSLRSLFLSGCHHSIDLIVISRINDQNAEHDSVLIRAHLAGVPVIDSDALIQELFGKIPLEMMTASSFILDATYQSLSLRIFQVTKRITEPVLAILMFLCFIPLFMVIAVLIKLDSKGPVFFVQNRTGYLGKKFRLVKFRSMRTDAEAMGPQWCSNNDERITKVGNFLRKTRIDELPQVINVIRGEMSFFGPRPERPEMYKSLKEEIPDFYLRTLIKPGITGWAQVFQGYAASVEESRAKLEYDLYYIQHVSPFLDLTIIVHTILVACFGDKAGKSDCESTQIPQRRYVTDDETPFQKSA